MAEFTRFGPAVDAFPQQADGPLGRATDHGGQESLGKILAGAFLPRTRRFNPAIPSLLFCCRRRLLLLVWALTWLLR
jgi:hypothetical protein